MYLWFQNTYLMQPHFWVLRPHSNGPFHSLCPKLSSDIFNYPHSLVSPQFISPASIHFHIQISNYLWWLPQQWQRHLQLNVSKTKLIIFLFMSIFPPKQSIVSVSGITIYLVSQARTKGVILDCSLHHSFPHPSISRCYWFDFLFISPLQHSCPCLLGLWSLARTTTSAPPTSSIVSHTHQLCSCQSVNVKPASLNLLIAHLTFSVSPGQDKVLSLQLATGPCGLAPVFVSPHNSYQPLSGARFSGNNKLFAILLQLDW